MPNLQIAFAALSIGLVSGWGEATWAQTAPAADGPRSPQVQVVPAAQASTPATSSLRPAADGCWVSFYDGVDFSGDQLMLLGPLNLLSMQRTGKPWRDWDSVIVGPGARVTTYDAENLRAPSTVLAASAKVADMTWRTGLFDDIESIAVECRLR